MHFLYSAPPCLSPLTLDYENEPVDWETDLSVDDKSVGTGDQALRGSPDGRLLINSGSVSLTIFITQPGTFTLDTFGVNVQDGELSNVIFSGEKSEEYLVSKNTCVWLFYTLWT